MTSRRLLATTTDKTMRRFLLPLMLLLTALAPAAAQTTPADVLGRDDIRLLGAGLRVTPARQVVPKDIASIVSTFLQAPTLPDSPLPPFAPDAIVRGTLRGPGFAKPVEITTRPNTPFNLPPFSVAGLYTLDGIRLESGGEVLLYGAPESVTIEVIEKLLVTQVTARPLTAEEIREKGIVFDKSNFQAYNFTAAFAVGASNPVPISFPVVLPRLEGPGDVSLEEVGLGVLDPPKLPRLETIIPDTLRIQTQIPNLQVVGFTLGIPELKGKKLSVPPIPGIVVIPGDIGFLNQFFNVTLMVGNVAPLGSNLVVSELSAEILLPAGRDNVPNSDDDPLRMARTSSGESARVRLVMQPGADGKLGTGDDIGTLSPGETGSAEYLVEGRREGTHVIEMAMTGILSGLPVGPVTITGRAAGTVLVRNPTFTLTFTHPDLINTGEPYTLDVTVTNTSESPANFVSVNLHPANITGAQLVGAPTRDVEYIAPGDSATVSFDLIALMTGPIVAATIDSDDNVNGRFALKTSVGELGIPLSPDSLVLPKETASLPTDVRAAALGLLGKAWAVATAPAAALPAGVTRFSKQVVYDRAIELAEAGFRYSLGEPLPDTLTHLALDYVGNDFTRIPEVATTAADRGFREADARGFDELRRASIRGDVLAAALGAHLGEAVATQGLVAFHGHMAQEATWRPAHLSIAIAGNGGASPYALEVTDPAGLRMGGLASANKIRKEIPFGDLLPLRPAAGEPFGELALIAVPAAGEYVVRLSRTAAATPGFAVSVVVPDGQGGLRHVTFPSLGVGDAPATVAPQGSPFRVRFELVDAVGAPATPATDASVVDPAPRAIAVVQQSQADLIGCNIPNIPAGRVVAVLFSEEVTKASVQDGLTRGLITGFSPEANLAVGVALQPGGRIAFIGMRDSLGPFVPRTMTIRGAADRRGQAMDETTLPMQSTIAAEGGVVSGRVINADGTTAVGVDVRLFAVPGCSIGISEKAANEDGTFSFDFVLGRSVGASRIVAVEPRTGDSRGVNFALQRNGQRLEVNVVFLGRGAITGRTLDEDGTPVAKTAIRVTSLTDRSQYGATTDETGTFSVSGVPVGNVLIEAVNTVIKAETTQSEFIPAAGALVVRDITLLRDDRIPPTVTFGAISGVVLRGDGTSPAADVPVIAYYKRDSQPGVECKATDADPTECALAVVNTDANGAFTFAKLASGKFRLETFDQLTLQQGEAGIVLQAGGQANVTILLDLGLGTVNGVVLDPSGAPVAGARVGGGLSIVTSGADGRFTLTDVPVGRREIVAVSDALKTRGTTVVDLIRAGDTANATVVLEAVATITGRLTRADGVTPASLAKVHLFFAVDDGVRVVGTTQADATGAYRFEGVALREDYRVSSFVAGFSEGNIVPAVAKFANQVVRADIRYLGRGVVRGTVVGAPENGADGTPMAAAVGVSGDQLVVAGGVVGVAFKRVTYFDVAETSIETGRFEFRNVWQGAFTLSAVGAFSPEPVAFDYTIAQPGQILEVTLQLQATSEVTGTVLLPDGVTPAGRNVQVRLDADAVAVVCADVDPLAGDVGLGGEIGDTQCKEVRQGVQRLDAVTDDEGRFTFPIVPVRSFTLTATDPGSGRLGVLKASVRPGETADIGLRLLALPTVRVRVFSSNATTRIPGALVEIEQNIRRGEGDETYERRLNADANGDVLLVGANAPVEGEFTVKATDVNGNGFDSGRVAGTIRQQDDGKTVTLDVFLYDQSGTVTGTVFQADGLTPVPNAEVTVSTATGAIAFAVTDGTGSYRVEFVPLGEVFVDVFEAARGRRGFASGAIDLNGSEIVLNVTQYGLGLVRGQLFQTNTLAPLKAWDVRLSSQLPSGRALPGLASTTDPAGRFYFPGVVTAPFRVHASKRGVAASGNASASVDRDGQVVDLPIVVDIARPQFGVIEGTVFNPDASPAAFAQVVLGGGPSAPTTTAAADGTFAFTGVPLGRFVLRATPQVGATQEASASGELAFENDIARVSLILGGTATVTGTVVLADGVTPAPFANVFLTGVPFAGCEAAQPVACSAGPTGQPSRTCAELSQRGGCLNAADASGRFAFARISARSFSVVAETTDGRLGQVGGPLNPNQSLDLRVVLSDSSRVSGRVLSATGTPVALAVAEFAVSPLAVGQPATIYAQTAADGTFVFESIRTGGPFALSITDPLGDGIARRNVTSTGNDIDLGDIVLDQGAPTVVTTDPLPATGSVPLATTFRVVFSEPVDLATVTPQTISLTGPGGPLTSVLTLEPGDLVVSLRPLAPLAESTRYTLQVRNVKDRFGKPMTTPFATTFTAIDLTPPTIVSMSPQAAASGVPVTSAFRVQFNEPVNPARFTGAPIVVARGADVLAGRTDYLFGNTVIVFTPTFPLLDDTSYEFRVAAATDTTGNTQAAPLVAAFSTTDRTPPQISAITAPDGGRVIEGTTIDVTATAASAFDVAYIDFYVNGVLTFTDRQAPFVLPFLAAPSFGPPGTQVGIAAVATDTSGNRGTQLVGTVVEIAPDAAPGLTITSPADGFAAGNNQRITLQVVATDDVGIVQVAYRAETGRPADASAVTLTPTATASQQSFGFNMPSDAVPGSTVRVTASVRDTKGQTTTHQIGLTVLDAVAPTVAITGTTSGARVLPGSRVQVIVAASDPGGVARLTFRATGAASADESRTIDPVLNDVATAFAIDVPAAAEAGQVITLSATATDVSTNTANASQLVLTIADRQAPALTLRTSTGRLDAVPGTQLVVIADASDEVGVARITLRGDGAFTLNDAKSFSPALGSATAQFTINVPAGAAPGSTLALTSSAIDLFGNTSDPVSLLLTIRTASDITAETVLMIAGERASSTITSSVPAGAGGLALTFTSRNAGVVVPVPAITIPEGQTTASVALDGIGGGTTQVDVFAQGVLRTTFTVTVRGGVVRGTVIGPNGPAPGVNVSITVGNEIVSTATALDGTYFVEGLSGSQSVDVKAADPATSLMGYSHATMNRQNGFAVVDVVLIEAGRISGIVKRANGTPAGAGALVQIFASNGGDVLASVFTRDDSAFEFPLVTRGAYRLDASDTNGNRGRTTAAIEASGDEVTADIGYLGRGVVTGTVRADGGVLPNAVVTLNSSSVFGSAPVITTNAGLDGVYRVEGVFIGSFSVNTRDQVSDRYAHANGTLDSDGQVAVADLVLADYASLEGRVLRADGSTPVPNARVRVSGETVTTGADGTYRFDFLRLGSQTVTATDMATAQGISMYGEPLGAVYAQATASLATPRTTVTLDVVLPATARIIATVRDQQGNASPGATVTVKIGTNTQSRTGTTDAAGITIVDHLMVGNYSVSAVAGSFRSNTVTGTLVANEEEAVTLSLEPLASIRGLLVGPDGVTPVVDGFVNLSSSYGGFADAVAADGSWAYDDLRLSTYTVYGFDSGRRLRGVARDIRLDVSGEVEQRTIVLAGDGTVSGRLINPDGSGAPNRLVELQALAPTIGGAFSDYTDAAGFFSMPHVPAGAFRITAVDQARQLAVEATGEVPFAGGNVQLDLALVANSVTLPTTLFNANGRSAHVGRNGADVDFIYTSGSSAESLTLDLTVGGTTTRFAGAAFGTFEDGGREIVTREQMGDLLVTRKVYAPRQYFTRYLETFTNTSSAPVTVGATIVSRVYQEGANGRRLSSSGDSEFTTADRWWVVRRAADANEATWTNGTSLAFAVDGDGAAQSVSSVVRAGNDATSQGYTVSYGWTATVAPGETVSFMHFNAKMHSEAAALAAAQRLQQLPPEAIQGLNTVEIAAIRNFAVPADGLSTLDPLPSIGGTVRGKVYEFDGTTPVPRYWNGTSQAGTVRFRSSELLFGRVQIFAMTNTLGDYSFVSSAAASSSVVTVPLAPFTLRATHAWSNVTSPDTTGTFAEGETTVPLDIVFSNTSILTGTVVRHTGLPVINVSGAQVNTQRTAPTALTVSYADVNTTNGTYRVYGVPAGTYTLTAMVPSAQGGSNVTTVVPGVEVTAGQPTVRDITVVGVGSVSGVLTRFDGTPAVTRTVSLAAGSFTRSRTTDTAGAFTFIDVPVGTYTLSASDSTTGLTTSTPVVVSVDQTTIQNLTYIGVSTLSGTVRDGTGAAVPSGRSVTLVPQPTGTSRNASTNTSGVYSFANVVAGTYLVRTTDPVSTVIASATVTVVPPAPVVQDLQYTSTGTVSGRVLRPSGVGVGLSVQLYQGTQTSPTFTRTATSNATTGAFTFAGILPGAYNLTAVDPVNNQRFTLPVTVAANQSATQDIVLNDVGSFLVVVTLEDGSSTPLQGATIRSCRLSSPTATSCGTSSRGSTDASGQRLVPNQLIGRHYVTVTHPTLSANSKTAIVEIVDNATVPTVAVSLPVVANLRVTVRMSDGTQVGDASITARFGPNNASTSGTSLVTGQRALTVFGDYRVSATLAPGYRIETDIVNGTITQNGVDVPVTLTFPETSTLTGTVRLPSGAVVPNAYVEAYSGASFYDSLEADANGAYSLFVPAGVKTTVFSQDWYSNDEPEPIGMAEITPAVGAATLDLVLDGIQLPVALIDGNATPFRIEWGGRVVGAAQSSSLARFNTFATSGTSTESPSQYLAGWQAAGRQIDIVERLANGTSPLAGLFQRRAIYVPADGYFIRYVDTYENRSATPMTFTVSLSPLIQSAWGHTMKRTSSGDAIFDVADQWLLTGNTGTRRYSHVFAGAGGVLPTSVSGSGSVLSTWSAITLQPGQKVAFLHFGGEHRNESAGVGAVERLVQLPPEALVGLTDDDRAAIVNFVVPVASTQTPFATVTGRVTLDGTTPAPGAVVTFTSANSFIDAAKTVTADENGDFAFTYPVGGSYSATAAYQGATSPATTGTLGAGQSALTVNISFTGGTVGQVRGRVLAEGAPVAGATVELRRSFPVQTRTVVSDAAGEFTFFTVSQGSYRLRATLPGGEVTPDVFEAIAPGEVVLRDLHQLTRSGTLTVSVTGADGTPIDAAWVSVVDIGNGVQVAQATGATNGQYVLTGVRHAAPGMQVVVTLYIGGGQVSATAAATFPPGTGHALSVPIVLPVGTLTGTVYESNGSTPVELATVVVSQMSAPGNVMQVYADTDAQGRYSAAGVIAGPVSIEAYHPGGMQTVSTQGVVADPLQATTALDVVFGVSGTVSGVVTRRDGSPAEGAAVSLAPAAAWGGVYGYTTTAADGSYTLANVPLGAFTLQACVTEAEGDHCGGGLGNLLTGGQALRRDVAIPDVGSVSLVTGDDNGEGMLLGVQTAVSVHSGQFGPGVIPQWTLETDTEGVLEIPNIPIGTVLLSAFDRDGNAWAFDITNLNSPGDNDGVQLWRDSMFRDNTFNVDPPFAMSLNGRDYEFGCEFTVTHTNTEGPSLVRAMGLRVSGNPVGCLPQRLQGTDILGQAWAETQPFNTTGVLVTRSVAEVRNSDVVLMRDTFVNTTSSAVTLEVEYESATVDEVEYLRTAAQSGSRYVITGVKDSPRDLTVQVFAGNDVAALRPTAIEPQAIGGRMRVRFTIVVPGNSQRHLMSAVAQVGGEDAPARAVALAESIADRSDTVWQSSIVRRDGNTLNFTLVGGGELP